MIRPFVISGIDIFLKFVISNPEDMFESIELIKEIGYKVQVFYQPVDNDINMYRWMVENGPEDGRYILQLHKLAGLA